MKYWVLLDFETASATDLKKAGAWKNSECPTTEILCAGYQEQTRGPFLWHPGDTDTYLNSLAADPNAIFIAFNAAFEKAIWRNIMVPSFGFPDIPNERWHDVQAVAAMKVIPQDMGGAAAVLGLVEQKTDFDIKKLSRPSKARKTLGEYDRSPETLAEVDRYCLQDVVTEVEMHKKLGWLPAGEREVWLLNQKVNERGIRIDLPYVRNAKRIVADAAAVLLAEFRSIAGLAPRSRASHCQS